MYSSGVQDIDISITTRELSRMIKSSGIDFLNLPDENADDPLGIYTGAGTIFGATGGVMEAALRTAYAILSGSELKNLDLEDVRGMDGVKEASLNIAGKDIKVAVAHQMGNVQKVMDMLREAKEKKTPMPYHFIEVMACRGGCIGGGGQPYGATDEIRKKRIAGMYRDDSKSEIRCSHNNPAVKKLYEDFLEKPLSHKSHDLLHTHYTPRPLYQK
jgi:NADH-quinone oxidoreductase subunit G